MPSYKSTMAVISGLFERCQTPIQRSAAVDLKRELQQSRAIYNNAVSNAYHKAGGLMHTIQAYAYEHETVDCVQCGNQGLRKDYINFGRSSVCKDCADGTVLSEFVANV